MDTNQTTKLTPIQEQHPTAEKILMSVYEALKDKGYDPISQISGYMITGDPTYITSYNGARSQICHMERDEIMEELVRFYLSGHTPKQ